MADSVFKKLIIVEADTSSLPKLTGDLNKAQAMLNNFGAVTQKATGITTQIIPTMDKFGNVVNKTMATISTESGKSFNVMVEGAKKSSTAMGDFERAMRRVIIVAPLWMIFRTVFQWITQTFNEGYNDLIRFEKAFINLTQTIKGYGGELKNVLNDLRTKIGDLSLSVGEDEEKIVQTFQKFNQAGMSVNDSWKATTSAIKGNITNFGELKNTVDTLTKAYILYKNSLGSTIPFEQQISLLQAKLLELRKNNILQTDDFNKSLANFLPIGKSVNFTLDEQLALIATLSNLEQQGGEAGARMSSSILLLSKNLREAGRDLGIIVKEGDNPFEKLISVLEELSKLSATGGTSPAQQKWIQELFGGQRTSKGGRELLELLGKLKENLQNISTEGTNSINKTSELMSKYNKSYSEVNDSVGRLQAKMKEAREEIGKSFIEGLVGANNFDDAMKRIHNIMEKTIPIAKTLGENIGYIGTALLALKLTAINPVFGIATLFETAMIKTGESVWRVQIDKQKAEADRINQKALADLEESKKKFGFYKKPTIAIPSTSTTGIPTTPTPTAPKLGVETLNQLEKLQRAKEIIDIHVKGYNDLQMAQINLNRYISDELKYYNEILRVKNEGLPIVTEEEVVTLAMQGNYKKIADLMKYQGDSEKKLLEVAKLVNGVYDERAKTIEKYSDILKDSIKTNIAEQLEAGTASLKGLLDSMSSAWRKSLIESSSTMLSEKLTQFGGFGESFGKIFANIQSPLGGAFNTGATMLEQAIIRGCTAGANILSDRTGNIAGVNGIGYGNIGQRAMLGAMMQPLGGAIGGIPGFGGGMGYPVAPADYYKTGGGQQGGGIPGWFPFNQKLNAFGKGGQKSGSAYGQGTGTGLNLGGLFNAGMGAYSAYQSGGTGAGLMAGVGGIMMMIPGLQPLGMVLTLASMFMGKKKSSSTQSSWQPQTIQNMPLNVITGGAPLPETYPLPSSAYWAGRQGRQRGNVSISLNIEKIEGTNEEIANKIADKVSDIFNRQTNRGLNIEYPS
jgi:TP901 family phage tail tape measure protein